MSTQAFQLMQDIAALPAGKALPRHSDKIYRVERLAEVGTLIKMLDFSCMLIQESDTGLELIEGTWEFVPVNEHGAEVIRANNVHFTREVPSA